MPSTAIPIIAIFAAVILPLGIGLIAILTEHQRKMAEIIHRNSGNQNSERVQSLERQVDELKELLHQQTIAIDGIASAVGANGDRVEQRLNA